MIDIVTIKGELYRFDPETDRIFKGGRLLDSSEAEPVYSNVDEFPVFSGIFLKDVGAVLTRSGKINTITDINTIF